jgi:hypothetical protein
VRLVSPKGRISLAIYAAGILLSFANPWIAIALYVSVAALWLVPDRRIERTMADVGGDPPRAGGATA